VTSPFIGNRERALSPCPASTIRLGQERPWRDRGRRGGTWPMEACPDTPDAGLEKIPNRKEQGGGEPPLTQEIGGLQQ